MEVSFQDLLSQGGVILSLPRYQHRFEHTKQRLEEAGFVNLQFYKGVDGFEENLEEVSKTLELPGVYVDEISTKPGHIACTLSHITLWKKIVDDNLPYLLIFEDDALPHPRFKEIASQWWDRTPRDVDMILLGNQMDTQNPLLFDPHNLIVRFPAFCLHAYIVTQQGAKRLLQLVKEEPILKMNDVQVMEWMAKGLLNFVCWNAAWVEEKVYQTFKQDTPLETAIHSTDMIVDRRNTGLIYQNFCLGHTLAQNDQIFNIVLYAS